MCTPRERLEVKVDGRTEILEPGRSRIHPDHEWVKARPELWRAAWTKDEAVRLQLKIACHLAERRAGRRSARQNSSPSERGPRRRVLPGPAEAKPVKLP